MSPCIPKAPRLKALRQTATRLPVICLLAVPRAALFVVIAVFSLTRAAVAQDGAPAAVGPLRDGDRVVFLGDTFFEREGRRGFIETALVAAHPAAELRCRNLGWSGDTVWADSRGVFDAPAKGYSRLLALVSEIDPTIVFVAYGRNEAERGAEGIEPFRTQLTKLCGDLRGTATGKGGDPGKGSAVAAAARPGPRLVLVTPTPVETVDAAARNALLARYADAIRAVAAAEGIALVDLFAAFSSRSPTPGFTVNGIHLSDAGYAAAAEVFAQATGGRLPESFAAQSADLRRLVVAKNTLFFHRWRPANETYIFLFRRHEQGNNAVEMPQFDPLVEEAERRVRAAVRRRDAPAANEGADGGREAKR